ncbi:MAG TPA: sulfate/molybdate ABC transporter ATP-binding protein [Magnetospirillaceae bacterium]|jgi:sulfate transport system ATP-binding protein
MITLHNIKKRFNDFTALDGVSLHVNEGEMVALLGPSGSGKTTLLRIMAGLDTPDSGQVMFGDVDATGVAARDRRVGFVFQHYALFRHMTVFNNVAFGLTVRDRASRPTDAQIGERVHELLRMVQLDGLSGRYPAQLSGGQRQRVALARALAIEPRVLLLDEPFGALDARVRKDLRRWLRRLHDDLGITGVFVTHDQEEAIEVADRIVVMNQGRIEQVGTPSEVYDQPATAFVYQFLGNVNALPCRVTAGRAEAEGLVMPAPGFSNVHGAAAIAYVRPHDLALLDASEEGGARARVNHVMILGPTVRVEVTVGNTTLEAEIGRDQSDRMGLANGQWVKVMPRLARIFLTDPHGDAGPRDIDYHI